jgi:hypothetical protein
LFELLKGENLVAYPDAEIRLALQRAVAKENPRGWKITKEKASHKIDIVVAMAMAALGAVKKGAGGVSRVMFADGSFFEGSDPTRRWPEGHGKRQFRVVNVDENDREITPQEAQAIRTGMRRRRA